MEGGESPIGVSGETNHASVEEELSTSQECVFCLNWRRM